MSYVPGSFTNTTTHPERRLRNRVRVHAITRKKEDSLTFVCDCGYRRENRCYRFHGTSTVHVFYSRGRNLQYLLHCLQQEQKDIMEATSL